MRWMCGAQYLQGPRAGVQAGGEVRPAAGAGLGAVLVPRLPGAGWVGRR